MRVTTGMVTRNYTKQLNQAYNKYIDLFGKATTGKRFNKMSEDTAGGVRAMQIRRNLSRIDAYESNVKSADSYLDAGQATLLQVEEIIHSTTSSWVSVMSGDKGDTEREILCNELEKLRDELLTLMNGRYSSKYMFGGSNTIKAPFTVDDLGNLYYNGVDVRDIDKNHPLMNDAIWLDIGLGVSFSDGEPQAVNDNTAFNSAMIGAKIFGLGEDNLYLVLSDMINMLQDGNTDKDAMGDMLTKFQNSSSYVNQQITQIGADQKYLEFSLTRLSAEKLNLQTRQSAVEGIDVEEALMSLTVQEYVYSAALQMGQRLLQPTLFNFIS